MYVGMDSIEIITSLSMHPVTSNNLITSPVPPYKAHHYGVGKVPLKPGSSVTREFSGADCVNTKFKEIESKIKNKPDKIECSQIDNLLLCCYIKEVVDDTRFEA
ncbi:hypothetical protein Lal_00009321 [Lupinus albus]|nr:hypothetical protein Lal_00009321 [Lupinus albus]